MAAILADDTFKCIFMNEKLCILIQISLKFFLKGPIDNKSSLVQIMACRLFSAKPLPESMMFFCQLDSQEQISVKFKLEFYHFHSRKCISKCRLPKWRPFCPGGDELNIIQSGGPV